MKVCKNCRKDVDDNATVCPYCRENPDVEKPQAGNYNPSNYNQYNGSTDRAPETVMCILSFLFPIVGIIYYIIKHGDEPTASKAYLKWAVISIVICIIGYVILAGCSAAVLMSEY